MLDLLRSRRDRLLFLLAGHPTYVASVALLAAGLLALVWDGAAVALGVLGLAASAAVLLVDGVALRRLRADVYAQHVPLDPDSVVTDEHDVVVRALSGTATLDVDVGTALRTTDPEVIWTAERFVLRPQLRALAPAVLHRRVAARSVVYNGHVVRLPSDLSAVALTLGEKVELRASRYFDGECSNELVCYDHRSRRHGTALLIGRDLLVDKEGRLRPLAGSWCANHVGVSTVALTRQGRLLVVDQSARSAQSPSMVAPSGSGSLEPRDVRAGGGLSSVVVRGMERELREEWGLRHEVAAATAVTGCARWWERGGKPEFLGVSVVDAEVEDGVVTGRERLYVADHRALPLAGDLDGVTASAVVQTLEAPAARAWSLPLVLCLRALASALEEEPDLLVRLSSAVPARTPTRRAPS